MAFVIFFFFFEGGMVSFFYYILLLLFLVLLQGSRCEIQLEITLLTLNIVKAKKKKKNTERDDPTSMCNKIKNSSPFLNCSFSFYG
jgi:hypothetical protein